MHIDHVNIVVSNMDRSLRFYIELLGLRRGFEVVLEGGWIETVTGIPGVRAQCVFVESEGSSVRLELLEFLTPVGMAPDANSLPNTIGVRHVAFVVDEIDGLVARLRAAGVPLISGPVEVPFAVGAMGRKRLCYFHDPDGTLLEAAAYG